jgi:hypothetical protein
MNQSADALTQRLSGTVGRVGKPKIAMAVLTTVCLLLQSEAFADLASKLEHLVGYSIVASKTIRGWHDSDEKEEGAFKGCRHGRLIVFTDGTGLTCAQYGYQYAYRPTAIILAKRIETGGRSLTDFKMIVEDEVYDMRR